MPGLLLLQVVAERESFPFVWPYYNFPEKGSGREELNLKSNRLPLLLSVPGKFWGAFPSMA